MIPEDEIIRLFEIDEPPNKSKKPKKQGRSISPVSITANIPEDITPLVFIPNPVSVHVIYHFQITDTDFNISFNR